MKGVDLDLISIHTRLAHHDGGASLVDIFTATVRGIRWVDPIGTLDVGRRLAARYEELTDVTLPLVDDEIAPDPETTDRRRRLAYRHPTPADTSPDPDPATAGDPVDVTPAAAAAGRSARRTTRAFTLRLATPLDTRVRRAAQQRHQPVTTVLRDALALGLDQLEQQPHPCEQHAAAS